MRIAKNPGYSLRAMARQLGISPALLSQIFHGRRHPSQGTALDMAHRLGLRPREQEYFELLIQKEKAQDPELRESIARKTKPYRGRVQYQDLSVDYFRTVSDWYHFAILALTEISGFVLTPETAAKRLGISRVEAELAIERLLRLEMLAPAERGELQKTESNPRVHAPVPNKSVRRFHKQCLEKAIESLESQTPQEKVVGTETIAIDSSQIEKFRELIENFFDSALALAQESSAKDQVYHLGVQFFKFTQGKKFPTSSERKENV